MSPPEVQPSRPRKRKERHQHRRNPIDECGRFRRAKQGREESNESGWLVYVRLSWVAVEVWQPVIGEPRTAFADFVRVRLF
jgi:hypothetical protein